MRMRERQQRRRQRTLPVARNSPSGKIANVDHIREGPHRPFFSSGLYRITRLRHLYLNHVKVLMRGHRFFRMQRTPNRSIKLVLEKCFDGVQFNHVFVQNRRRIKPAIINLLSRLIKNDYP